MEQHPVPRQITTFEFKLIGFMTLRQFLYLVIFFPLGFIVYKVVPIQFINILFGVLTGLIGVAFAFIQIQERPLEIWIKNLIKRMNSPTQYIYKKQGNIINSLDRLYFATDPHIAIAHVETKEKLNKYLSSEKAKKNNDAASTDPHLIKQQTHINDLLEQTKNTDPTQIKKPDVSLNTKSQLFSQNQIKQPFLTGVVKNRRNIPLPGILVSVKDDQNNKLRLLKTNPHGIFATYSQLPIGEYLFEIHDQKGGYFFDTMKIQIDSNRQKPLQIYSKELL